MKPADFVWKDEKLVRRYLEGVRGAIPLAREQLLVMLQLLDTRGRPIRRFLDLGCGDGILGRTILSAHPRARGVFVDFSPAMLAACRQRLRRSGPQTAVLELDYGSPGWQKAVRRYGPFDAVVSGFSIHHQSDARKRGLYREIFQLLGPGGWFINLEHVAPAGPVTHALFEQSMIENIWQMHQRQGRSISRATVRRHFVRRKDRYANILAPVEKQCAWLRRIGFADVDCYLKVHELALFGGRRSGAD
ncbi:MAG TPA: class I SAM-dependent methyltransferase [Verrucomicrobiae bacterium]|nr:class I SAM-dependent methyltransferase [Verrucomicrobiae bacterium]